MSWQAHVVGSHRLSTRKPHLSLTAAERDVDGLSYKLGAIARLLESIAGADCAASAAKLGAGSDRPTQA